MITPRAAQQGRQVRARIAFVAACGLLAACGAQARPVPSVSSTAKTPAADDGLRGGGLYLEADTLVSDEESHQVIAKGHVVARYHGRILHADEVMYDSQSEIIHASGSVSILNPDGTSQFSQSLTLNKDQSDGLALDFAARLQGDVKIAAARARRETADVTRLDRVIYTPCLVCADGHSGQPTWSIRARSVVQDRKRHTLKFKDAVVQIKGVSVFYLPILAAADPSAPRKSGFLLPYVTVTGKRGFTYDQPYYQVISPSQDLTLTPQINTKVNPFLNVEWRKRFYSGQVDIRGGYTFDQDFTSGGAKFGQNTSRSYILGRGLFKLSPQWQWGFTAERASDKLIFDKYSVNDVFVDRGLYASDDRRLISQIYALRQDSRSFFSIAAISVQGLRSGDLQNTFPIIAPLIEAHYEPDAPVFGGRLRLGASGVVLTRDQSATVTNQPGVDSRRATAQLDWRRTLTFASGVRVAPFLQGRLDLYNVGVPNLAGKRIATISRQFGTAGFEVSYPLIKSSGAITYVLEPIALASVSPRSEADPRIPNEDSHVFEFDETNLFSTNRSPGYDIYEGGESLTLGGRATAILADGRSASVLFGRRLAVQSDPIIAPRTGLSTALSDYIFAADAKPLAGIRLFTRLRFDADNFAVRRFEAGAEFSTQRASGYLSYLRESLSPTGVKVSSLDVHAEAFPLKHWGVSAYGIIDSGVFRRKDIGLIYRDNCVRLELLYRHDETFNSTLGPSTSVILRLSLATFGN